MKYKHIIFDFDGVLVESNEIRFEGFRLLFRDYSGGGVEKLIQFSRLNAGLSRYEKIRYFFEKIRNESIDEDKIKALAKRYSELVKQKLIKAKFVNGLVEFLSCYHKDYDFAIVSGSDQEELIEICQALKIDYFFDAILGSPVSKELNLSQLFLKKGWKKESSVFIGDSLNDLDVARFCGIDFIARNSGLVNWSLIDNVVVINNFSQLHLYLM